MRVTDALLVPWRAWSRLCDLADAKLFTPYGRWFPYVAFGLLSAVCAYEAFQ